MLWVGLLELQGERIMRTRSVLVLSVAVLALLAAGAGLRALEIAREKENVVAASLEGKWRPDVELTKRLTGRAGPENPPGEYIEFETVEFASDDSVAAKVPVGYDKFLKDKTVYMSGTMTLRGAKFPFILISRNGNPHVVYFRPRDNEPMGDAESFNLCLAPAKDRKNDLLFIGGDFNNQPFSAFERAEK
jgi:hypothetical protein